MTLDEIAVLTAARDAPFIAVASYPRIRRVCESLFDAGWLTICPPGHRYKINDAGRIALASTGGKDK